MPLNKAILRTRYQILPDRFPITLTPKNQPDQTPIGPIQDVTRTDWSKNELASFGAGIESDRIAFVIPELTLQLVTDQIPVRGWWITDPDDTWTIKGITLELQDAMIRCACIKNV